MCPTGRTRRSVVGPTRGLELRDMCSLAYAMQLEELKTNVHTGELMAASLIAGGAKGIKVPDMAAVRLAFDQGLNAAPVS